MRSPCTMHVDVAADIATAPSAHQPGPGLHEFRLPILLHNESKSQKELRTEIACKLITRRQLQIY